MGRAIPEERVYEVPAEMVLVEVRALLEARSYRIRRWVPATGTLEAFSAIRTDGPSRAAHQGRVRLTVVEEAPGRTRVAVLGSFLEESEMPVHGQATFERPWPTFYYTYFFQDLEDRLSEAGPDGAEP
jgi:hypothetical protein